ncbi:MAG: hypothetical protein ACI9MB_003473 [Verrucomicrobiales bacterium]
MYCFVRLDVLRQERPTRLRKKWLVTKAKLEAEGVIFDLEEMAPPPVPDIENFAKHSIVAELFDEANSADSSATRLGKIGITSLPGFPSRFPFFNRLATFELADLGSVANDPQLDRTGSAKKLLLGLATWDDEFRELSEAASRRHCRYPFEWENLPRESSFIFPPAVCRNLAGRALCRIQLGESAEAAGDVMTLLQVSLHNRSNPFAIGLLVTGASAQTAIACIREGVVLQRWDEDSLRRFDESLSKFDFSALFETAIRSELVFMERVSVRVAKGEVEWNEVTLVGDADEDPPTPAEIYETLEESVRVTYEALFDTAKSQLLLDLVKLKRLEEAGDRIAASGSEEDATSLRAFQLTGGLSLRQEAMLGNARIAIAAERFRLKQGRLPGKLSELVPRYLPAVPLDPVTGKEPVYRAEPDGEVLIYSFGSDGDDDGGRLPAAEEVVGISEDGDWIWRTRPIVGE